MKRTVVLSLVAAAVLVLSPVAWSLFTKDVVADGDVEINETNFPDANFRAYVRDLQSLQQDDVFTAAEIASVEDIYCVNEGVKSMQGIEFFTSLENLTCSENQIESLDLSQNTKLTYVDCSQNEISSIDFGSNVVLQELHCSGNRLSELDVTCFPDLKWLNCRDNCITELKANGLSKLEGLLCQTNLLTNLSVVGDNALYALHCENNLLESEPEGVGNCPVMREYVFSPQIDTNLIPVDKRYFPDGAFRTWLFENVDTDQDGELSAEERGIESIDVKDKGISDLTGIQYFSSLTGLSCDGNELKALDVSNLTSLYTLNCRNNQIETLNLTGCASLVELACSGNQIETLDLSVSQNLIRVACRNNQISSLKLYGELSDFVVNAEPRVEEDTYCYGGDWDENVESPILYVDKSTNLIFEHPKPSAPSGVKLTLASATSANVSWDAVSGVDGYQVSRATSADGPYTALGSVTTTNRVCSGLTAGTTYYFKVRAYKKMDGSRIYSDFSSAVAITPVKPDAPSGVYADPYWASSVYVYWNAVSGADGYQVARGTSANGSFTAVGSVTKTSRVCTGLKEGATYYFKVRAYKEIDGLRFYSPYSSVVSVAPLKPAAPAGVRAAWAGGDSAEVSWSAVSGASGYQVWRADNKNSTFKAIGSVTTTFRHCGNVYPQADDYDKVTYYYFKVRAYKVVNGTRIYGPYSSEIALKTIPTPSEISAVSYSATSIKLSWNKVDGVDGYAVWRSTEKVTNEYQSYLIDSKVIGSVTTTERVCPGLTSGTEYFFQVRSYIVLPGGKKLFGSRSTIVSAVPTPDFPLPSAPSNVKLKSVSLTSIKLSWNKVDGVDGYQVWRAKNQYAHFVALESVTTTERVCPGLDIGFNYYFKVRAYKVVDGKRVYGAFSSAVTWSDLPAPTGITAVVSSATSVTVSWNKVTGATGYEVFRSNYSNGKYSKLGAVTGTNRTCPGLKTKSNYCFKVRAYKEVNGTKVYSAYSTVVSATPKK